MKAEAEQRRVAARGQGPLGPCVVERTERGRRDEDRGGSRGEHTPLSRVELEQQAKHKADAQGKRVKKETGLGALGLGGGRAG